MRSTGLKAPTLLLGFLLIGGTRLGGIQAQEEKAGTAIDLTTIDRTLVGEPSYQSGAPGYCLLVFGPTADTRIWLVVDGDILYVDRNGMGDLAADGNAVRSTGEWFWVDELTERDGKTRHAGLSVRRWGGGFRLSINLEGTRTFLVGNNSDDPLQFAVRPQEAPVIHLGGPLQIGFYNDPPVFVLGREAPLDVSVGTPGLGKGTFAAIQCKSLLRCKAAPIAEIRFPHRDPDCGSFEARVKIGGN